MMSSYSAHAYPRVMQSSKISEPLMSNTTPSINVGPSMMVVPSAYSYGGMSRPQGDAESGVGTGAGAGVAVGVAVGDGLGEVGGLVIAT